jgi:ethanolamine ammonia-lyase large subunit
MREQLRHLCVLANEMKEGDLPLGGTTDNTVREAAREELATLTLHEVASCVLVDDAVSEVLARSLDRRCAAEVANMTLGAVKARLLRADGHEWWRSMREGVSSESIAILAKLMNESELGYVARGAFNALDGGVGGAWHFGSRLQPNSAGDDEEEILFSILEGLTHGCGDVILGINPASDDVDTIVRLEQLLERVRAKLELPTRTCVLSDIVKQSAALARTHVDVGFQSLAGTSRALGGMVGLNVDGILDLAKGFDGLYFETGQGSEVTNGAAEGLDMVTLEARTYGLARYLQRATGKWTIVNDVAGFIGPEVFRTSAQLQRACLEDLVMAKLHGLTMGLDVCATFHMGLEPQELAAVTERVVKLGAPAYLMAVAGNADPMLGYLTTSFRQHPALRQLTDRSVTQAYERRLEALAGLDVPQLYEMYGGTRSDGRRIVKQMQERGWDIGYGASAAHVAARLDAIYLHARRVLYALLDEAVLGEASPSCMLLRSTSRDRDDYLSHPATGERLDRASEKMVWELYSDRSPQVQIVISDGLNADAVHENIRAVLPAVRKLLGDAGLFVGEYDIAIRNGRVRAGYHVGTLLECDVIVHLIGERPGTGINTLSAYLTYGRDADGEPRWSPDMEHSLTTAICGIHPRGRPPEAAAEEIVKCVRRMCEERRSGVGLGMAANAG